MRKFWIIATLILSGIGLYEYGSQAGPPANTSPAAIQQPNQQTIYGQQASQEQNSTDQPEASDNQAGDDQVSVDQVSDNQQPSDGRHEHGYQAPRWEQGADQELSNDRYYTKSMDGDEIYVENLFGYAPMFGLGHGL